MACCAGLPLLATLLGGMALAAVLGVAGGVITVVALAAIVVLHARRQRSSPPRSGRRPR